MLIYRGQILNGEIVKDTKKKKKERRILIRTGFINSSFVSFFIVSFLFSSIKIYHVKSQGSFEKFDLRINMDNINIYKCQILNGLGKEIEKSDRGFKFFCVLPSLSNRRFFRWKVKSSFKKVNQRINVDNIKLINNCQILNGGKQKNIGKKWDKGF